ncbi:MAG: right-handed parallel beta-helix repeat-containing protein [Sphaerochaetaceae bacterium]|nr:right-handed parallel beta-helix repeat-containing protein [Sphaerochaetaceae bacterium]
MKKFLLFLLIISFAITGLCARGVKEVTTTTYTEEAKPVETAPVVEAVAPVEEIKPVVEEVIPVEEVKPLTGNVKEEIHTFLATAQSASADKEAFAEGTAVDAEGLGYIKTTGAVVKRWKDGSVTSTEVGKAMSSAFVFTVTGEAKVTLGVSSNGGNNDSAIAIVDDSNNVVANEQNIDVVHGTQAVELTYNLPAGNYRIVSPANDSYKRGARVHSITIVEKVETVVAASDAPTWDFRYFGVSVGGDRNFLAASGEGVKDSVKLSSALFNDDGSIKKKGGKYVADSPADGGSYYFTTINPQTTNFYLQADVTIDQINPSLDGQEGFALMVRDSMGEQGVSGNWMANLISVTGTKLPYGGVNQSPEAAATIGVRAYTGIYTPEASDANDIQKVRYAWWAKDGVANQLKAGETYRVSLEKTDYAYITTQYDIKTNEVIGSYTYYIPAKDSNDVVVESYKELDDPLTFQEADTAYVALSVARGINATFSNIKYTTSKWNAENWKPQPTVYVEPTINLMSGTTTTGGSYNLIFRTNADGVAKVYDKDTLVLDNIAVKGGSLTSAVVEMKNDKADFKVVFTPNPDFVFSIFEKLSSYDPIELNFCVEQRTLGNKKVIFVSNEGRPENSGKTMSNAVDLQTALNFAAPGQIIMLRADHYVIEDALTIARGHNGTAEEPITIRTNTGKFATIDFNKKGSGFVCWGDYWNISKINITNTKNGKCGMQLAGHNCILDRMNFYNNGTTGLQVSGSSYDEKSVWPSNNLIKNCTSMNNADKALEDADGFAAKLTTGEGNVFDGCISAYNADDGWDLFAKVSSGQIGAVTIKNSLTYKNGYLMVKEGSTAKKFTFADVECDENGTLTFKNGFEMEAGNGNGFKMGGSSMPGAHTLINSIAYNNKTKGIDSNSCPDIKAYNCTTYNNGSYNIAMYTGNKKAQTGFAAKGVLSYRNGTSLEEKLDLQGQNNADVFGASCYYWDKDKNQSVNTLGAVVSEDWFINLDTSVDPERNEDGSINMHGLLLLKDEARAEYGTGARGFAWGQKEATVWVVGDSTVSPFNDKYYIPRRGYGEELASYFNVTVYNLARSGASSKDFTGMVQYQTLINGDATTPALGDAETDNFLVIGFGHNDEKTEEARYTDPNGDYKTPGTLANSLYENYIKVAVDRGVIPVLCTPIARLSKDNTVESYNSANGHITEDVTIGDKTFKGGDYSAAIKQLASDLNRDGIYVEVIDLTAATIKENVALGDAAQYLHAFTGAKKAKDGSGLIATGLDQTHTNIYGAKMSAYLISELAKETAPKLADYSLGKGKPTYEEFFNASINKDYVVIDYKTPDDAKMDSSMWPKFTDADGRVWHGTVFGDVGGANKITDQNFTSVIDGDKITLTVMNNSGKIASGSDGMMFYYVKLPVGTKFTLEAKAKINDFKANNQVSFGLMARDDLYIDEYVALTMGDYVAAGSRNQGKIVNFGRKSSALVGDAPADAIILDKDAEVDLKIVGSNDGYTLTYGKETVSAGFDYALTGVDSDFFYVGIYAVRNCSVTFSDLHLTINE